MDMDNTANQVGYSKKGILESKAYAHCRDSLSMVLEEGRLYTKEEIENLLEGFLNRPIQEETN